MNPMIIAAIMQAAPHLLQGIFGNSGGPSRDAAREYYNYYKTATERQNPFYDAGKKGLGGYADWSEGMKNPSEFINNLTKNYSQSPQATYLRNQAMRTGINAASASGLTGSTPFANEMARQGEGIASQDMDKWLGRVLGINTEYGASQKGLADYGQHSADVLSQLDMTEGGHAAQGAYGQDMGKQYDQNQMMQGILKLLFGKGGGGGEGGYSGGEQYPAYLGY